MRFRTAKFVMIPMWVMEHPKVRGDSTRIAVYAGLRAVAWEHPDREWRSIREIALTASEIIGISDETIRKHVRVLMSIGAILNGQDLLAMPDDEPELGPELGLLGPKVGSGATQTGGSPTTSLEERERKKMVAPAGDPAEEFAEFWAEYPRKKNKPEGRKAFVNARQRASFDAILSGLQREIAGWRRSGRSLQIIPYPATWLNQDGWENQPDSDGDARKTTSAGRAGQASAAQADEIRDAVDDGRFDDAWHSLVEKASSIDGTAWWQRAERLAANGRAAKVISLACDVPSDAAEEFLTVREAALAGRWPDVSQRVRELTA